MSTPEDTSLDVGARARALLEGADWDRLARVFAGEATSRERAAIAAWVAADPSRGAAVEALRQAWLDAGTRDPRWAAWSPDAGWHALAPRVAADATPSSRGLKSASPRVWPRGVGRHVVGTRAARLLFAIAAAVVIAFGIGVTIRHQTQGTLSPHEYATTAGQRLSVTLLDGTQLTLAPASRVRTTAGYGARGGAREVELEGEAYFAVTHDAAHPFAVRAHGAVARDIGTAFDIRAYPEDAGVRIAVAEGAAAVTAASECRVATGGKATTPCVVEARAGDVATVKGDEVTVRHRGDVGVYTVWIQGGLVFEDTPLRDAVRDLARAFDLDITVADSALLSQPITASFGPEPVEEALDLVTLAVGARYERSGRKVIIRQQPAGAERTTPARHLPVLTTARAGGAGD